MFYMSTVGKIMKKKKCARVWDVMGHLPIWWGRHLVRYPSREVTQQNSHGYHHQNNVAKTFLSTFTILLFTTIYYYSFGMAFKTRARL